MSKSSGKQRSGTTSGSEHEYAVTPDAQTALAWLKAHASKATLAGMVRYAIPTERDLGVSMSKVQAVAKRVGRNHRLAVDLWATGWYEARLLAAYVDDPKFVTSKQMNQWCRDFDHWAICDTVCFALFDRTSHAWSKVEQWSQREGEFIKRAAFALLWGLSMHDKSASDDEFIRAVSLVERAASDDRNFVKKAVNMALRAIGKRNVALNAAALATAERLATLPDSSARWVGRAAHRELSSPAVAQRLGTKKRDAPRNAL